MPPPFLFPQCVALQALNINLSLRGTGVPWQSRWATNQCHCEARGCRGNLSGAVDERFVSPHFPSAEIASSLALLARTNLSTLDFRLTTYDY